MNVADSQRVASALEKLGYTPEKRAEDADIIVMNTCVVRQSAEDKAYGRLSSLIPIKRKRPEVVINSAGQDNHYSDPLAHMRVSAQGYARLNETLAPDLAVLEGGYSIQSALPYVNLAIILAMAGLSYAHVREPDYDPAALAQSAEGWESIRRSVDALRGVWEQPEAVRPHLYPRPGETYSREKQIYYDTDGIHEQQSETVRMCDDCPGWLRVDSQARGGTFGRRRVWAMAVPWGACARCADEARAQYQEVVRRPRAGYDWLYLQDRPADEYWSYDVARGREERVE